MCCKIHFTNTLNNSMNKSPEACATANKSVSSSGD